MAEGAIARTLRVLEVVCAKGPQSLKALSDDLDLAPPTLLRILRLMAEEGYVTQLPDRTWRGTMLVWSLGCAVNATVGVSTLSQEHTDTLTTELDETSVYAVYEQGAVTYAAHSEPAKPVRANVRLGRRHGLLSTTTGHAVLAWLDDARLEAAVAEQPQSADPLDFDEASRLMARIRADGYVSGSGVKWPDLWAAAAPVFDASGQVVGALGVSIPAARADEAQDRAIEAVVREADAMTRRLGGSVSHRTTLEA
ncbi:IclR family transcriptional regulator (plasmid) [Rhodococcus pyridinivorans]|nr:MULTISPECIES: IclR family transcriptional regulator [Rhodococcus]MCT7293637.1 IclR family transcriptional regulator [Rhodococcus sp. PAE-6]QXU56420.1 IclR family transcriptional regulator [Rhodococcus sp. LW-XY12]UVT27683.1 IclR family transcriptional regulator [Rhodococcus pyridinivorans]WML66454.1 IclR family transcriptional regulator [Rhodococcus sp. AH-ZY2]UQB75789.1 IclR family transcriptional regulator [Rhodococcus ruber]